MNWIQRTLRAFAAPSPSSRSRRRLGFDALEDRTVPSATGMISGNVFYDNDGNLFKTGTDFNVPGATVALTGTTQLGNAINLSTTTTAAGTFQFLKLEPGTYQVSATVPSGPTTKAGLGNLGGSAVGNQVQSIVLSQGQNDVNLRFAFPGAVVSSFNPSLISLRLFLNDNVGDPTTGATNKVVNEFSTKTTTDAANDFTKKFVTGVTAGTGKVLADGLTNSTVPTGTAVYEGDVFSAGTTTGISGIQVQLSGVSKTAIPLLFTATTDAAGHYKFGALPAGAYFINVLPGNNFRAFSSVVGTLGGSSTRSDQLAPTFLDDAKTGSNYNFFLAPYIDTFDAALANDVANGTLGTATDGITSDPSIRGRLVNPSTFTNLEARFTAGGSTGFVSVKDAIAPDGTFLLTAQTLRDVFGGGFPDGAYTVEIRATPATGAALTKSVSFTLKTNGPSLLSTFTNISNTAAAANTTLLLAGAFTDPNITNSTVTLKVLKGTTPVDIHLELFDKDAPRSVANFFNHFDRYALSGGTLFHRLHKETGLNVLQGGGFNFNETTNTLNTTHITQDPAIRNEFSNDRPNVRGSIAMAKTSDADSATSEFFFNLTDSNANTLGVNNGTSGGFTVFGQVMSDADLAVLDDLATAPIKNTGSFNELPLLDGNTVDVNNLERIKNVVVNNRDNELTYTVTSSNTAAVTATVGGFQGNQLTLDYQAAGTSTITVTATDKTGNTATTTFIVTVT